MRIAKGVDTTPPSSILKCCDVPSLKKVSSHCNNIGNNTETEIRKEYPQLAEYPEAFCFALKRTNAKSAPNLKRRQTLGKARRHCVNQRIGRANFQTSLEKKERKKLWMSFETRLCERHSGVIHKLLTGYGFDWNYYPSYPKWYRDPNETIPVTLEKCPAAHTAGVKEGGA
jgi:hypothetical protein